MTIDRDGWQGPITIMCDGPGPCHEICETRCTDFTSALQKAKSRGWVVYKVGDEWRHNCPDHGGGT